MTEETLKLTFNFIDPDLDAEDRDEQVRRFQAQLRDLDEVESIDRVLDPNPPRGNKAFGGFLPGRLKTVVKLSNVGGLLRFLGDRLSTQPIEIEIEANGSTIRVRAYSPAELTTALQTVQQFAQQMMLEQGLSASAPMASPLRQPSIGGQPAPVEVFFSYSHRDEDLRHELANHLSTLRRQGLIAAWHDREITAGSEWAGEIDAHLNSAQIILLLVSANFLASDYCYDIELKQAMQRHALGTARVIPVILRPCDWEAAPFGRLKALPQDGRAVTTWSDRDAAFLDVARGIRSAIQALAPGP